MYMSTTRFWISCVPCKHITNDIIMPDGCQYVHWFYARSVLFHFVDGGKTSLRTETRGQLCNEGPLECGGRCRVRIAGSYCLRCRICKLPSLTLRESETVQQTLNVMSANGRNSLRVSCPLGECGEGSLCPHAVQVALATDPWGAVQVHPASNGLLADDQGHDQVAGNCRYVGERHGEEKLLLGERMRAQEGKDGARPTGRTFRIILIAQ